MLRLRQTVRRSLPAQTRRQASSHSGGGSGGPYNGFVPPMPSLWHTATAKALGATMWFFIFYRFREV
ncbi:uncharacterized protein L969DRAFT_18304 [Mixia osmundae IAM 14324]|uniref:uncharacterized protein n=1 Tax=Mixia osmundae (strain CBS 9802 / IAM 14324 / JCM 22182 / KY 12970) TaxID=764103 RepID=UPI0004A554CA|nr:uncharacterized protein L969DRAFT_18304 [Mixia osmundae IAM 14324]KEI38283.1 hypothetical protein L969DRAFT_18304 [Mixia osmundae IAM 14324]